MIRTVADTATFAHSLTVLRNARVPLGATPPLWSAVHIHFAASNPSTGGSPTAPHRAFAYIPCSAANPHVASSVPGRWKSFGGAAPGTVLHVSSVMKVSVLPSA